MHSEMLEQERHNSENSEPQYKDGTLQNHLSIENGYNRPGQDAHDEPTLPGDGRHATRLLISLAVLFTTGCISPLVVYFALKYVGHSKLNIAVAIPSAIFDVFSLLGYVQRFWSLGRNRSVTRPVGGTRWGFDYFHWNFTFGFILVTIVISVANALKPPKFQVAALPMSILLIQVGLQLVLVQIMAAAKVTYFCRISSMPPGSEVLRPALYTIIEDLVAVEGKQGTSWRADFDKRYQSNPKLRSLLGRLSWLWGLTSLAVAAVDFVLIFTVKNLDVAWVLGWSVPWVYVAIMSVPTYFMVKSAH